MSAQGFQIENGWFALTLVDKAAVGYEDTWQAPGGKTVEDVLITDYGSPGGVDGWACQVTRGEVTASANENTVEQPATFCQAAESIPQPGASSFTLETEFLQDPQLVGGLSAYLHEHDTKEAFYVLGLAAEGTPPTSIGRVRLLAGNFGGVARANLTSTLSLPVVGKPDHWYGNATAGLIVPGDGSASVPTPTVLAASASSSAKKQTAAA